MSIKSDAKMMKVFKYQNLLLIYINVNSLAMITQFL